MTSQRMIELVVSELDIDILYRLARGQTPKQIAFTEGLTVTTVRSRVHAVKELFGATSVTHLVAMLIASDVLRVQDLYREVEVIVREYRRDGENASLRPLKAMRA